MENIVEKLGIFDFFNLVITGSIFYSALYCIFPTFLSLYWSYLPSDGLKYGFGAVIFYLTGLLFQEISSFSEKKLNLWEKQKSDFLSLASNKVFNNSLTIVEYRKYARELLASEKILVKEDFTREQAAYALTRFQYYNLCNGYGQKTERMRSIYGMSTDLFFAFIILTLLAIISFLFHSVCILGIHHLFFIALYLFFIYLFYNRANRSRKLMIKFIVGTYVALKSKEVRKKYETPADAG